MSAFKKKDTISDGYDVIIIITFKINHPILRITLLGVYSSRLILSSLSPSLTPTSLNI